MTVTRASTPYDSAPRSRITIGVVKNETPNGATMPTNAHRLPFTTFVVISAGVFRAAKYSDETSGDSGVTEVSLTFGRAAVPDRAIFFAQNPFIAI